MTLVVEKSDGTTALGTAFLFARDGMAITAFHLIRGARAATARFSDGEEFGVSGTVDSDERRDIALIRVKVAGRPLLQASSIEPEVGSRAYVIGAPRGLEFSLSEGIVSQIQTVDGRRMIQFTCAASPGNSGGPLLTPEGKVCGIVSEQVREGQNLNFAVPVNVALGLDNTLPTKPWEEASSAVELPVAQKDSILDESLAHGIDLLANLRTAMIATDRQIVKANGGFRQGVPAYLYRYSTDAKRLCESLKLARSDSQGHEAARTEIVAALSSCLEASDYLMQAIHSAQGTAGWTPEANDLYQRGSASLMDSRARLDRSHWKDLLPSPAFTATVSPLALVFTGLKDDTTGFTVGTFVWVQDPAFVVLVQNNSLASRLGIESGDRLLVLNGEHLASLDDFKARLKLLRGEKFSLTVRRRDQELVLTGKVPVDLPPR